MSSSQQLVPWKHKYPRITRVDEFRRHINLKYAISLENFEQLHKWSTDEIEAFCKEIWIFCGVTYSVKPAKVGNGLSKLWPRPEWFPGAQLNFSENLLSVGLATHPDSFAISACGEGGTNLVHVTWKELYCKIGDYANALKHAGVRMGDRVAGL